jgi:nitrogen fixation/metabolism regulation signal transduction histidine kinase
MRGLKLGQKLVGLFLVMALIVVITGLFGITSLNRVGKTIEDVIMAGSIQSNQVVLMKTALQECRLHLLEASSIVKEEELEVVKADYQLKRDRFEGYIEIILKGNARLGLPAVTKGSSLEERAHAVSSKFLEFSETAEKLFTRTEIQVKAGRSPGNPDSKILEITRAELPASTEKVATAVDELLVTVNGMMQQANKTATSIQHKAQLALMVVIICAILCAVFFGTLVSKNIVSRIKKMDEASNKLADGDMDIVVNASGDDEIASLGKAMNKMAATLKDLIGKTRSRNAELEEWQMNELWLKSGLNDLNNILREDQKTEELASKALNYLIGYLGAGVGVIYQHDDKDETLQTIATYAVANSARLKERIKPGEGLAGQALLERKMINVTAVPHSYLPITSALGEADPLSMIVLPIMHNDRITGVLEIGAFKSFDDKEINFLHQATDGLAIAIQVNRSRDLVNELLEQTQSQAQELRVQQEELQQTNEELEERARLLAKHREKGNQ